MIFLGIELLQEWIAQTRRKLPVGEWLIVLVIVFTIAWIGFVEGLALGILLSAIMFTYDYSRLNVIKLEASGSEIRSNVDRARRADALAKRRRGVDSYFGLTGVSFFWHC